VDVKERYQLADDSDIAQNKIGGCVASIHEHPLTKTGTCCTYRLDGSGLVGADVCCVTCDDQVGWVATRCTPLLKLKRTAPSIGHRKMLQRKPRGMLLTVDALVR